MAVMVALLLLSSAVVVAAEVLQVPRVTAVLEVTAVQ